MASALLGEESQWAHLLQPIKDMAANWDINIAHELEEYLVRRRRTRAPLVAMRLTQLPVCWLRLRRGSCPASIVARSAQHESAFVDVTQHCVSLRHAARRCASRIVATRSGVLRRRSWSTSLLALRAGPH